MHKQKISLIFKSVLLFFLMSCGTASSDTSVKWYDLTSGMIEASRQGKPVVIDFYADWCHWCKVMDKETFSETKVAERLKNDFIAIRVDTQSMETLTFNKKKLTPNQLSLEFGVQGLPTVVFLDKTGEYIDKLPGFIKAEMFFQVLGYIKDECYKMKVSFKDYTSGKIDCKK